MRSGLVLLAAVLAAGVVEAQVPDPSKSTAPAAIYLVGTVDGGASPDPAGAATVIFRDAFNNPIAGGLITIDLSACCDIVLCTTEVPGQIQDCAARTIRGYTNASGEFTFRILGAARDPGDLVAPDQLGGCGAHGVRVYGSSGSGNVAIYGPSGMDPTLVCLDQNGGAGRSNGTTGSDVSAVINLFGTVSLGAPYRGRGDLNANGVITAADVAAMIGHVGRLATIGGAGCMASFCGQVACP